MEIKNRPDITDAIWEFDKRNYGDSIPRPKSAYVEIDHRLYRRRHDEEIYVGCLSDDWFLQYAGVADVIPYQSCDEASIVCVCGCPTFTVFYGSCELLGQCTHCSRKHTLYS